MQDDGTAFQKEVRKALAHLHDLAYLDDCPLAHTLSLGNPTPGEDEQERGEALRRLLLVAVERLVPPETPHDDGWQIYDVLYHKYVEGLGRQEVMDRLFISRATFHRNLNKAIAAVCDFLRERERDPHPPQVSPRPIPRIENFVGRGEELAAYRRQLETGHCATIVGLAGVGKTALGAELAAGWQARGRPVVWIDFCEGRNTDLESLLETIALSLAAQGQDACWRFLQNERRKEAPLSPESHVRYLLTVLEQGGYLLCLDDFQLVNQDRAIGSLCADLLRGARRGQVWLLVMSRVTPRFTYEWAPRPLGGLCREDACRLLETAGLPALPEAIFAALYARTAGLPIFLKLFAAWAHGQGLEDMGSEEAGERVTAFVEHMVKEQDVRPCLLREMYQALDPQERRFLICASVFRTSFEMEDEPIIALLATEGVQDIEKTWMALTERYIFVRLEEQVRITLHPLVREYFCHRLRLSLDDRARIHRRVGEYYEESVGDVLEAAYHYVEAGDAGAERAARLLSKNVTQLINAGRAEAALEQLERLTPTLAREAGAELRFEAAAAREKLCHLLGRREKQRVALETMLDLAEELDDGQPAAKQLAMTYNRRARFHKALGEFTAAIAAARSGLEAARRAGDSEEKARSLVLWGRVLWQRGEYAAARERLAQALALAQAAGDRQSEAKSLNNLGLVCRVTGDYAAARDYFEQSLAIERDLGDRREKAGSLNNLGIVCYDMEDYATARDYFEQSLAIERDLGDRREEAGSLNNLGLVCCAVGDYAAARIYHEQALTAVRAIGDKGGEALCQSNLGLIYCHLGDHVAAREYCERALATRRANGDRQGEAYSLNNLGVVCHQERDCAAAREYHEQALAITQASGDRKETGCSLTRLALALEGLGELDSAEAVYRQALTVHRELGQKALAIEDVVRLARTQEARGRRQEARKSAEECLTYIAAHGVTGIEYVFEVYLTCVRVLEACGERGRARGVLAEAHALLMERADKIDDQALRCSFLENVPAHRELVQEYGRVRE